MCCSKINVKMTENIKWREAGFCFRGIVDRCFRFSKGVEMMHMPRRSGQLFKWSEATYAFVTFYFFVNWRYVTDVARRGAGLGWKQSSWTVPCVLWLDYCPNERSYEVDRGWFLFVEAAWTDAFPFLKDGDMTHIYVEEARTSFGMGLAHLGNGFVVS